VISRVSHLAHLLKRQHKAGPLTQLGIDIDASPVGLQDVPGRSQTQAKSIGL
jgi:hypothetical protein